MSAVLPFSPMVRRHSRVQLLFRVELCFRVQLRFHVQLRFRVRVRSRPVPPHSRLHNLRAL